MSPIRIPVTAAGGDYPVLIEPGLTARVDSLLVDAGLTGRPFVITSPTIWKLHAARLPADLQDAEPVLVPDGERFKQLSTVTRIYNALIQAGADRTAAVVAVGGGVIGDMAGFAAATYLRGIPFAQVPTTLLAQVDSAIGGKVGVNHPLGKNLIGAFYPPRLVVVDPELLETLPRRDFRAGLYEVVKYGMIASRDLFDRLRSDLAAIFARRPDLLVAIVADSCRIKAAVVGADERERGGRRVLNFGHTIGHALEAVTRYRRFRHGETVAYGMLAAARLATRRGALAEADRQALQDLIVQMGPLPPVGDLSVRETLEAVRRDKKILAGRLHFVLPTAIGATTIVDDVAERELEGALRSLGMR